MNNIKIFMRCWKNNNDNIFSEWIASEDINMNDIVDGIAEEINNEILTSKEFEHII